MGIELLDGIDDREFIILSYILQFQIECEKGVSWGELFSKVEQKNEMARNTFSNRLKGLIERGLVEKEKIMNKKGNPTLLRLESKLFRELKEIRKLLSSNLKNKIDSFEEKITSFSTPQYVEAMMELSNGLLDSMIIILMTVETDGAKWMLYDSTYKNIEMLYRKILKKASKSPEDRNQTLTKLFEILKPLSKRPIGKHFALDVIYDNKEKLLKKIDLKQS